MSKNLSVAEKLKTKYHKCEEVTNFKDMLERSAEIYKTRTAFKLKDKDGKIFSQTYESFKNDVFALGTKLIEDGFLGKRIAVIGKNSYMWAVSYLAASIVGIVVPLDKELHTDDIINFLNVSEASCMLGDDKNIRGVFEKFGDLKNQNIIFIDFDDKDDLKNTFCYSTKLKDGYSLLENGNKEFEKINLVQDSIIDFLANYPQVQIVGGAGTGKTFMAIKKICRELALQHSVLYICRNRALSRFVECQCNNHRNLKSYNFDDYLDELLGTKDKRSDKSIFDLIDEIKHDYYDAIIVDEAQDFSLDEALAIRLFLRNEKESCLYVFYDKNQNLFDLNFEDVFGIDAKPYILRYNIRNTGEIYNYATRTTGLGYETQANQLLGVVPEIKKYKSRIQALTIVSQILNRLIQKEYVNTESIVILSDQLYEDSLFSGEKKIGEYDVRLNINDSRENSILFASVSEFKGLEADIIIYLKNNGDAEKDGALRNRENYVACTRARYYLYVLEKN